MRHTFKPLAREPVYAKVAQAIEQDIVSGALKEGAALPTEGELCEQFGVTRSSVREGIRLLEQAGLIERGPAKRLIVKSPKAAEISAVASRSLAHGGATFREVWETLAAFYPGAARLAAARLDSKALAALKEQAEKMMRRFQKGQFNMNDLRMQLEQMQKMGGMEDIMSMMPGKGKMKSQMDAAGIDDRILKQQIALIQSMTKKERANPALLQASRKKRIASGSGMDVSDLNKLLKMHRQMADMMKKMGKMGKGGMLKQAMKGMFGGKGGLPSEMAEGMDQKALEQAAKQLGRGGGLPGLGGGMQLPSGLSGLGKKK